METLLKELANKIEIDLTQKQISDFLKYKDLLIETNKYMNLTAIVEDKEVILKHFIDSLTINKYVENNSSLIDIGTGAGFPGIPVKIIRKELNVTLLDSLNKRLNFLNDVIKELELDDIKTVHGRAEDIAHMKEFREKFDYATARAVANLSTLSEFCLPFVKIGGYFICMKGTLTEELDEAKKAIEILGGEIILVDKFMLPDSDIERNIVLIKKKKATPIKYPRKAGIPSKEPIK